MSEDLLYDKKDIVPDDSGLMKRKGIEPYRNVVISDENGNELLEAYLDYVGSKIIVIQLLSIWDAKKLEGKSLLYFKSLERYDQVYKGTIEYIDGNAVFFSDFENISHELKDDLKVDYMRKAQITITDEETGEKKNIPVVIKDVSGGGTCFMTQESLRVGEIVEVVYDFTRDPLLVKLKIIRKENHINDVNYHYGCRMLPLNMVQESMIKQAIFRIDIENKRGKSKFEEDMEEDFEENLEGELL